MSTYAQEEAVWSAYDEIHAPEMALRQILSKPIREAIREELEVTTNLPEHVMARATEQIAEFVERRIAAERHAAGA